MYDLLVKGSRVVDGSGTPSFHGDVGIAGGLITAVGRLDGPARREIDADGLVAAPGFIDNHCHYDAQVTWDPWCTFSPNHGVTTVVVGNCSLGLAPARPDERDALAMMLSRVEAIPIESLEAGVQWGWETFPEYLDFLEGRLAVNVGALVGHSPIRRYVMGESAYERSQASEEELGRMQAIAVEAVRAGALGLSFDRKPEHRDLLDRPIPSVVAPAEEVYRLASALAGVPSGVLQCGAAEALQLRDGFASKLAEVSGRPVVYAQIRYDPKSPESWRVHLAHAESQIRAGWRVYPLLNPSRPQGRFSMSRTDGFDRFATWRTVMRSSRERRRAAFSDPATRDRLRTEASGTGDPAVEPVRWDRIVVARPLLDSNRALRGRSVAELAAEAGRDAVDLFLDLTVEEDFQTRFSDLDLAGDGGAAAMGEMLRSPYTIVGLSDAGAHVRFDACYGFSTTLLGHWVREQEALSLEEAVRKLTSVQASLFGIRGRGLLQPGFAADVVLFDEGIVASEEPEETYDLPGGVMRLRQAARGVMATIVNGEVNMEDGQTTDARSGQVVRGAASSAPTAGRVPGAAAVSS